MIILDVIALAVTSMVVVTFLVLGVIFVNAVVEEYGWYEILHQILFWVLIVVVIFSVIRTTQILWG